jgi:hypothetical protein
LSNSEIPDKENDDERNQYYAEYTTCPTAKIALLHAVYSSFPLCLAVRFTCNRGFDALMHSQSASKKYW